MGRIDRDSRQQIQKRTISSALRQVEAGTAAVEICRKMEITETTFYRWKKKKKKYFRLAVSELRELMLLRKRIGS
jgi:putative transposase